ncbi:FAD-binding protein [Solihabitans fulvus]|uniref:FAD-binding protein n=1 Tax=Solihabitans fulvus TaxID=1892852 RepID=A0A5B2WKM2_9PSEU|nr:cholesterol oxidase substrate-binding domain-containing protein [Solihabitans fulvus]KAA2250969.1 FAD-binding protein [Solihabitans fulvus]
MESSDNSTRGSLSRRRFLGASAAAGLWMSVGRLAAEADPTAPQDFPPTVELYREQFQNWDGAISTDPLWTCAPRTQDEVVAVVNWAHTHQYRVRASGHRHSWSPLTVVDGQADAVLLVDTTRNLTALSVVSTAPAAVRAQTGASMESLLTFLEDNGYGVTATPAAGDITVGGVLAVDGHGSAVPASGEARMPGHTYGSLSNLVTSLTAVVWDAAAGRYVARTFDRAEPDCAAFLTHVGRAFLTEVTLRVGANYNLRCVTRTDVPASDLFAPTEGPRSLSGFLDESGRVGVIWFAFTDNPWMQIWTVTPHRPFLSRPVFGPYNYPFADNLPQPVADLAARIVKGETALAPIYGQLQYTATVAGLTATLARDMWGPSKNFLLYVRPTTMRVTAGSYAIHTSRGELQHVLSEFVAEYQGLLAQYRARGLFPINGGVEIRVTGLDHAADVGVPGAQPPALSAVRPREDHPEWDVAVWLDVITFPDTPGSHAFYRDLEDFFHRTYTGSRATARVEWSKRWGHTEAGAWTDQTTITQRIPDSFRQGPSPTWDRAVATLNSYDPDRVFGNPLLDVLLR